MRNFARLLTTIAVSTAMTVPARAGSSPIEILTPPPFTAVGADHICIVGRSGQAQTTVSQGSEFRKTVAVKKGVFHARIPLKYGFNEVFVAAESGDSVWLAIVRLPFLSEIRRSRIEYPLYRFHGQQVGEQCVGCHSLAPFSKEVSASAGSACSECHPPEGEWQRPHRPVAQGNCAVCHGSDAVPVALPMENTQTCRACHGDKIREFNKRYQHGPVGAGECLACHTPHGSAHDHNLRMPVEELCTSCHQRMDADLAGKVVHAPFGDGTCTDCHDPHATNFGWGLARRSNSLCMPCHPVDKRTEWHSHPVTGKPRTDRQSVALNDRGELECASCHAPHFGKSEHLLRTDNPELCRGCHEDK